MASCAALATALNSNGASSQRTMTGEVDEKLEVRSMLACPKLCVVACSKFRFAIVAINIAPLRPQLNIVPQPLYLLTTLLFFTYQT